MAYQRDENEEEQPGQAGADRAGLLGGYLDSTAAPGSALAPAAMPQYYGSGGSAPSATGHVNFDRIYAANEGVSNREATRMGSDAQQGAQHAQQGLAGLQSKFSSQSKAAEGSAPTEQQRNWATYGSTNVAPGKRVTDVYYTPSGPGGMPGQSHVLDPKGTNADKVRNALPDTGFKGIDFFTKTAFAPTDPTAKQSTQSFVTEEQEPDYAGPGVVRDKNGNVITDSNGSAIVPDANGNALHDANGNPISVPYDQNNGAADEAAVRAAAAGQYNGPGSLQDVEGYKGLLDDYRRAQGGLAGLTDNAHLQGVLEQAQHEPHIEGGSRLDAALIGQAGRPEFERLGQQYRGLGGEVGAATKASFAQGAASKAAAEQHAAENKGVLDEYLKRQGIDLQHEADSQAASDKKIGLAEKQAFDQGNYNQVMANMSAADRFRNTMHTIANNLNPVDIALHATGNKSITDRATDSYGQQYGPDKPDEYNPGNSSAAWGPDDADVFASMTPADWTEFNALGEAQQRAWIAARKSKIRGG